LPGVEAHEPVSISRLQTKPKVQGASEQRHLSSGVPVVIPFSSRNNLRRHVHPLEVAQWQDIHRAAASRRSKNKRFSGAARRIHF